MNRLFALGATGAVVVVAVGAWALYALTSPATAPSPSPSDRAPFQVDGPPPAGAPPAMVELHAFGGAGLGAHPHLTPDTVWTLVEIAPIDGYIKFSDRFIGKPCRPVAPIARGAGWYRGEFDCGRGENEYFAAARFDGPGVLYAGDAPVLTR